MIIYLIKSTVCLLVLYGFFHFLLRSYKILLFNRFYLIFSLVFSLIIPLIIIPTKTEITLIYSLEKFTVLTGQFIQQGDITEKPTSVLTFQYILTALFIIISSVLFIRFALNILRIFKKIVKSKKVKNPKTSIVLVEEKTLPYSFFKYVFVNRSDFENCKIEKGLLIHEEAHCLQYHSIDILILELINIVFWFNPTIWLFRKEILLNHEYYADNKVLENNEPFDYRQLLINLVIQNSTNYLVSNFKHSLTKNRLIMITKSRPLHNAILRKIAAIQLFLILAITLTFSQESKHKDNGINFQNGWWYPILIKHHIEPSGFNTFDGVFEMGSKNSINNRVVTLENAFFLTKPDSDGYYIIKSPLAYHDLDKNLISGDTAIMERYNLTSEEIKSINTLRFKNFMIKIGNESSNFDLKAIEAKFEISK